MQKFIFVITSILILCLIGCSDVVGQGTGGAQDVITNQENNSASTNNEYDSPEREIEMLKMQNLDLDQYNKQLRSDIEKMQKDIQQEQMINNILQEDITNLSCFGRFPTIVSIPEEDINVIWSPIFKSSEIAISFPIEIVFSSKESREPSIIPSFSKSIFFISSLW